jgi:organic hydroperoxide reductase OsmC/OhrA
MSTGAGTAATTIHRARVVWEGGKEDLRAHRIHVADRVLEASSAPELGGDPAKADPEELLVAALSSCHMLWFLSLSRERRLRVASYEDAADGTMDGTRFTRVTLRPSVEFAEPPEAGVIDELHHEAHERCFIANSVNFPVEVEPA